MKKGKRLLVVLLATLVMLVGAVSVTYAAGPHTTSHSIKSVTPVDDKLYMICLNDSCQFGGNGSVAAELKTPENAVYSGARHEATVTTYAEGVSEYSLKYTGTGSTTYTESSTAPKNAGTYIATAVVKVTASNLDREYTLTKEFTISQATLSITWTGDGGSTDDFDYAYTGSPIAPNPTISSGKVGGDDVSVAVDETQTEAGSYTATAVLSGSTSKNYSIDSSTEKQKFSISGQSVWVKWTDTELTYNASTQNPTATFYSDAGCTKEIEDEKLTPEVNVYTDDTCQNPFTGAKMNVGTYYAKVTLSGDNAGLCVFGSDAKEITKFTVDPYELSVSLYGESSIDYDGKYHRPEMDLNSVFDGDDCVALMTIKGTQRDGIKVDITDVYENKDLTTKAQAMHASSGKYTASISETKLAGEDARNYVLSNPNETFQFKINPLDVDLDWYRPATDEYGDLTGGAPVLCDKEKINLVFDGTKQAPTAKIKDGMILTQEGKTEPDECEVTLTLNTDAIEVGEYKVQKIDLGNKDYTADDNGATFHIVARPVKLQWDAYYANYNGEEQERSVEITNVQLNAKGKPFVNDEGVTVAVSEIKYYDGKHFGTNNTDGDETNPWLSGTPSPATGETAGTDIAEGRIKTDAGTRIMEPVALSDPHNYTFVKLNPNTNEPQTTEAYDKTKPEVVSKYVDLYAPIYTIHQHKVKTINWSDLETTYNASYQLPTAVISDKDLQGPDTKDNVALILSNKKDAVEETFKGFVNWKDGGHTVYIPKKDELRGVTGNRNMNYRLDEDTEAAGYLHNTFTINKKALKIKANDVTIYYGDEPYNDGVTYDGLINGNPNKTDEVDGKPGTFTNDEGQTENVVKGEIEYTINYKKNGKYGTYDIKIDSSNLESNNYNINLVNGKLYVNDRVTTLNAKGTKSGKKRILVSWNSVTGAASYDVYMSLCNTKKKVYTPVYVGSTTNNSFKVKKIGKKKLKAKTPYKYYVVAKNASGAVIAQSTVGHFITNNVKGKKVNAKSMAVNANSVTISKGSTAGLSASYTKAKKGKKYKLLEAPHAPLSRYVSENTEVATVDANGTVYGVGTGWCRVYVLGVSGMWETVEVYVN